MESTERSQTGLTAMIKETLTACLERGMRLPFVLALVSPNSSVMCIRYEEDEEGDGMTATVLVEHNNPAGFALPINIMITDQTGAALRVKIDKDGRTTFH